jgi:putative ABC transport system substrate-binding protein
MKSAMAKERADAFIVLPSPILFGEHKRIVDLAAEKPATGHVPGERVRRGGGLMSYGVDLSTRPPLPRSKKRAC